jgi:hypothetical protein
LELVFENSKDLLACYVDEGPGQLLAALPGPPAPGTLTVGGLIPITLAFRDRPLRIPVRCRVLAVRNDGDGHWTAQLEFTVGRNKTTTLGEGTRSDTETVWPHAGRGPVRVRVTLADGRRLEATARGIGPESIDLDLNLPPGLGDIVKLSIRPPGKFLPIKLMGEPKSSTEGRLHIDLLFRQPREELLWSEIAEKAAAHPSRMLLVA